MLRDLDADDIAEAKQSQHVERVLDLLPLLGDKAFTLQALGKVKGEGGDWRGVKVSSAGQADVTLAFDPATGLLRRAEYREKQKALGKEVLSAAVFDDYRAIDPIAAEEAALKAAKVASTPADLLQFLREQVRSATDREKVKKLVQQLSDDAFEVREKASAALVRLGGVALPELRKAAKSSDAEVATRAARCLEQITGAVGQASLLTAALRVVAARKPAGAAEVLLALAPALTDADDIRELRTALAAVARAGGKPDKAVEAALNDPDPARRSAAAAALGKDDGAFDKVPGRRIFVTGVKRPLKTTYYQDGQKQMVLEFSDMQFFNRFDDKVFARPK